MKVILLQDVPKVGQKYQVKEVAPGFAQNRLFPQKLAELATPARITQLEAKRETAEKEHAAEVSEMAAQLAKVHGNSVVLEVKANEQGHLFQAVKVEEIVNCIDEKLGVSLTSAMIERQEPIKDLGEYEIPLRYEDAQATVTLHVKAAA